ncbi:YjjG family noncanonical pyrimidine nucleotidase [Flavobacterium caeni]|uniref:Putative hydrolase of the HAD superfamily n=1 Tax=Flavobacterium caeni TaxID=490189 RepID=A0A1G5F7L5_9FLAO|nr:YjjG family noncanonical pyrimidine nucleotidase [Flavobacterium caeni]SCY35242.1 putative hydrolase of the HAD superfamily [Flavobacterium caeni]
METITDVFFDLDHTLWDFERNSALAFAAIFEKHAIQVPLDEFLTHYVPINLKYWNWYRDEKVTREQLRYGRFKDAFDLAGYAIDRDTIDLLSDDYIAHLPIYNHLFDGTIALLDYLKPKYRLHIITNGFSEVQRRKIDNANIGHYFTTITDSEMAGVKKPNPIIFEYALTAAQADRKTSIMIGDCIDADVRGALGCGIDAILFTDAQTQTDPYIKQISHLSDLKNYL